MRPMPSLARSCGLAVALAVVAGVANADPPVPTLSPGWRFSEQTGEALSELRAAINRVAGESGGDPT